MDRGARWIASIRDLVAYPQDYWALWVLSALWAQEIHARQGTGNDWVDERERTLNLIRGFRVRVPGGVRAKIQLSATKFGLRTDLIA